MSDTSPRRRLLYESGEWEIDVARRELRARGAPVPIGSRAFDIIEVLVRSAGELVTKHDLTSRVWPGAIVEDNALQFHISAIRKALGPDRELLRTASGRGYRLLGDWTFRQESTSPAGSIDLEPVQIAAEPFQTNLPAAASDLVGRTTAVRHLRDLLSAYRLANSNFTQRRTSMISQDDLRPRYPVNRRAFVSSLLERLLDRTLLIQMTCATVYL